MQARIARGVLGLRYTTPNLPKGPLFATKRAKNGVLRGGLGPKGPLSGDSAPPPPKKKKNRVWKHYPRITETLL